MRAKRGRPSSAMRFSWTSCVIFRGFITPSSVVSMNPISRCILNETSLVRWRRCDQFRIHLMLDSLRLGSR